MRLEIEEAALAKESDTASQARLTGLRKDWPTCAPRPTRWRAQWEPSARRCAGLQALREQIEQVRRDAEQAERDYDLNKAAELRLGQLPSSSAARGRGGSGWPPGAAAPGCSARS